MVHRSSLIVALCNSAAASARKYGFAQLNRPPFAAHFGCACPASGGELAVVVARLCSSAQSCGRRRQRASAKRMANRLDQMAPSLVNNLRQSRMYLLCSQRIIAEAQNWLRVIEALGLSLHANSRQQRPRIPFHDPSCQRRLFSTDANPPSLLPTTAQLLRPAPSGFLS